MTRTNRKSGLTLTPAVFRALHKALIVKLKDTYGVSPETLVDYQLYGFNYYDEKLPSIRKLILDKTGKWVNGKYLYNKYREWKNGNGTIKLTREFVFIYFKTIGYKDVTDFLKNSSLSKEAVAEQIDLEKPISPPLQDEYYIGYYLGEESNIILTALTLSESKLKAHWALTYWEKEEEFSEYLYEGSIQYQQNGMSLIFKNEDTVLDRSLFISIFCERQIKIKPFLIGAYSGYDRDRQPVVGEVIFQRVASEKEQKDALQNKTVSPIISQHISGRRWIVHGRNPQNLLDVAPESKYASKIEAFVQDFKGIFVSIENGVFLIELSIKDDLGTATLSIAGHPLYKGVFKVQASGQLIIGRFSNDTTKAPLFMSIQVLPIREQLFTGDLLGVSRFDKSFSGKVYISSSKKIIEQLPSYRGSELSPAEINDLPDIILTDLTDIVKNNQLNKYFEASNSTKSTDFILHLAGNYEMHFLVKAKQKETAQLKIEENGMSTLTARHIIYEGKAVVCEGGILSVQFTHCNGIQHCGQIMGQVGRKSRSELKSFNAKWLYLDERFDPKMIEVSLAPRD